MMIALMVVGLRWAFSPSGACVLPGPHAYPQERPAFMPEDARASC